MFTSRAEYRLNLRHDSADQRLTPKGYKVGLKSQEDMERLRHKMGQIEVVKELLSQGKGEGKRAIELLRQPEYSIEELFEFVPEIATYDEAILYQVELDVKYEGYVKRQERQIERFQKMERISIPQDFNWDEILGLSTESRQKFKKVRPLSVGQASRISGVRSSDLAILMVALSRKERS